MSSNSLLKTGTRNRCDIWSLSDSDAIRTHDHLVYAQPFSQNDQMIQLCCEYLSVRSKQKFTEKRKRKQIKGIF